MLCAFKGVTGAEVIALEFPSLSTASILFKGLL